MRFLRDQAEIRVFPRKFLPARPTPGPARPGSRPGLSWPQCGGGPGGAPFFAEDHQFLRLRARTVHRVIHRPQSHTLVWWRVARQARVRANVSRETETPRTPSRRTAHIDRRLRSPWPQPAIRLTGVIPHWGSGIDEVSRNRSDLTPGPSYPAAVSRETLSTGPTQPMGVISSASQPDTAHCARRTQLVCTTAQQPRRSRTPPMFHVKHRTPRRSRHDGLPGRARTE